MDDYYRALEGIRRALVAAGEEHWANDLLTTERSVSTSGEALALIGNKLAELNKTSIPEAAGIKPEVEATMEYGHRLWDGTNR